MLKMKDIIARLKPFYASAAAGGWASCRAFLLRHWWLIFMALSGIGMLLLHWARITPVSGMGLVLFIALLVWLARQWPLMQVTVATTVLIYLLALLTGEAARLFELLFPLLAVLLLLVLGMAAWIDFRKSPRAQQFIAYAGGAAMVISGLLLLLLATVKPDVDLRYASMPLVSVEELLLWGVLLLMYLYLLFQRQHARVPGEYILLFPVMMIGLYAVALLHRADIQRMKLPVAELEHGLLLLHVPAMVLAFVLLLHVAGLALLRLLSDTRWLRAGQNSDVLETIQTGLSDYIYRHLRLAVLLLGVGLLSGMIWSELAWGRYWQAEAKLYMSLALFLYYLAGLHFRLQRGLAVRPFAWWCLAGLPLSAMTVFGTNWWSEGLHKFTGL